MSSGVLSGVQCEYCPVHAGFRCNPVPSPAGVLSNACAIMDPEGQARQGQIHKPGGSGLIGGRLEQGRQASRSEWCTRQGVGLTNPNAAMLILA